MTCLKTRQRACQLFLGLAPKPYAGRELRRAAGAGVVLATIMVLGGALGVEEARAADGTPPASAESGSGAGGSGTPAQGTDRTPSAGDRAVPQRGAPQKRVRPRGCPYRDKPLNLMV